jgi:hypothetical protein
MVSVKKLKQLFIAVCLVASFAFVGAGQVQAQTPTVTNNTCRWFSGDKPAGCPGTQQLDSGQNPYLRTLVSAFIWAAGTLSFIFLLIGAIRYITASGNSARIQQAKDTVLYSIIGLIVVALAIPISDYVISILT